MQETTTNEGAVALDAVRAGRTYQELADEFGAPVPTIWRWCKGERRPETHYRLKLEKDYEIDPLAWDRKRRPR